MLTLNKKIKLMATFEFENIEDAIKVRNKLKEYAYKVSFSYPKTRRYLLKKEERLNKILNYLEKEKQASAFNIYRIFYSRAGKTKATFQRDIAILILKGKITMDSKRIIKMAV
jgi:hypothetical protein